MTALVWRGILLGLGANLLFDLWQHAYAALSGGPRPNWASIGRWFRHLTGGVVFHADIGTAAPYAHELALGWVMHYVIGAIYGVVFVLIVGPAWLAAPSLLPALAFGVATVGFGWFLLQPGLGLGIAASRTPNPGRVRLLNLAGHTVFGLGLWLTGLALA